MVGRNSVCPPSRRLGGLCGQSHWHWWFGVVPMSQVLRVELAVLAQTASCACSIQVTPLTVDRFPVVPVVDHLPFPTAVTAYQGKHSSFSLDYSNNLPCWLTEAHLFNQSTSGRCLPCSATAESVTRCQCDRRSS